METAENVNLGFSLADAENILFFTKKVSYFFNSQTGEKRKRRLFLLKLLLS
jgi:hypothetical protein